jgi:hypothetical protein
MLGERWSRGLTNTECDNVLRVKSTEYIRGRWHDQAHIEERRGQKGPLAQAPGLGGPQMCSYLIYEITVGKQQCGRKWEHKETVHQLFVDSNKASDSIKKEVLCNILTEFGVPMTLVRLIKICLNETYSRFHIGKYFQIIWHSSDIWERL